MKKKILQFVMLCIAFLMFTIFNVAAQATLYVATTGNDADPGTMAQPKKTIQAAINAAVGATNIYIAAGNYNENVVINKNDIGLYGVGAATNGNTAPGTLDPSSHTIITGGSAGDGIAISGARSNITVSNLAIVGYTSEGFYAPANCSNIVLTNLQVNSNCTDGTARGGIFINGDVNSVTIQGCALKNNGPGSSARAIGIWNGYKQNILIQNNYVEFINCCAIDLNDGTSSGVRISSNTILAKSASSDSGIGILGMKAGNGANIIELNNITVAKRYGIEIKNPSGLGVDDDTADGAILVRQNIINRTDNAPAILGTEKRDLAGIAVFRRSFTSGNPSGYIDVPSGVYIKSNTINGFQQPSAEGEGFGIVVEGVRMTISANSISNCDVAIQRQSGNASNYVKDNVGDADQAAINNFFNRGNSPFSASISVVGNLFAGNTLDTRDEFAGSTYLGDARFITNLNYKNNYVSIPLAIEYAQNGQTLDVAYDTYTLIDAITINKSLTIQGNGNNLMAKPIIEGVGNATNKALWEIDAANVTLSNFEIRVDQTGNAMVGISSLTNENFANLSILDNVIKGMKTYTSGYVWSSYAIKLGKQFGVVKNQITLQRNQITYNNLIAPELFGRGIYAYNCYGMIGGSPANKNSVMAITSMQLGDIGGGAGMDFEFSYNDVLTGLLQLVGASVGNHKISHNTFGASVSSMAMANNSVRTVEIRGSRTANANIEFSNNNILKYSNIGLFIQRSNNITVKDNIFSPFTDASNTAFRSIAVSSKEGTSGTQSPVTSENLTITGNMFNSSGVAGGVGITFYNHNADISIKPFDVVKVGGTGANKNFFNNNLSKYIELDGTPGGNTSGMSTLYDVAQGVANTTNILPFNGDVDATYNQFGSINSESTTDYASMVAVKAKIDDGIDDELRGYVAVQMDYEPANTIGEFANCLKNVPNGFLIRVKNDASVYGNLGSANIIREHSFDVEGNAAAELQFATLTVNTPSKEIHFNNPVDVSGAFTLTAGTISPSSTFTLNGSVSVTPDVLNFINGTVKVNNISSNILIPVGKNNKAAYVELIDVAGTGDFTVSYVPNPHPNDMFDASLTSVSRQEYWTIHRNSGTLTAKAKLYAYDLNFSGLTGGIFSDVRVAHFNTVSNKWESFGNSAFHDGTPSFVVASTGTGFSDFTFGSNTPVLPVELVSFTAQKQVSGVQLNWQVSNEMQIANYTIEKSYDGQHFNAIANVAANKGPRYSFNDNNFSQSSYYRLVANGQNGDKKIYEEFTKFVSADLVAELSVFPNPSTKLVNLKWGRAEQTTIQLYDTNAKLLKQINTGVSNSASFDISNLPSGIYFLKLLKPSGNVSKTIIKN